MNAVCPKLYYPKAFKHLKLAGLLACSILDAFPFPFLGTVALEISRTLSELTAAVSAQDFHLIPFSLIPPEWRDEHQIRWQIYGGFLNKQVLLTFFCDIS